MMNMFRSFLRYWLQPGASKPEVLNYPKFIGPLSSIPRTRNEVYAVFGNPGHGKPSKKFQRQHLSTVRGLPGTWNKSSGKLYMHDLMAPYFIEALRRAHENGSLSAVKKIGCYSFRHQQHDPRRKLSYHSWGIAFDVDPKHNRVVRFPAGKKPEPWSEIWMENWPQGVTREFVEAMESVGFLWGGRWDKFVDPMHFQLKR